MHKGRLEAFSDGVIAIIITIMVLELKVPHEESLEALTALTPVFASYILSFIYCGIYWNNHHHMLQSAQRVNGTILWANMHLLFWLSLFPFVTGWAGETHFSFYPVMAYGIVLLMAAIAYYILARAILALHGPESAFAVALGRDFKGFISVVIYVVGILLTFVHPKIGLALYTSVALIWLIPDKRFERSTR